MYCRNSTFKLGRIFSAYEVSLLLIIEGVTKVFLCSVVFYLFCFCNDEKAAVKETFCHIFCLSISWYGF